MRPRRFAPGVLAIATLALGLCAPATSFAATLTVTKTADTGDGVCDADCSLREALTVAGAGDTIVFSTVANGTITLLSALPTIAQSLTLTGNGAANTVIDGNNSGAYRCFNVNPAGGTVTLSDVTIRNFNSGANHGAAVYATNGTVNLIRSVISGNAGTGAGAIHVTAATASVTDSTVSDNTSTIIPGMYVNNGIITITGSTFSGNAGGPFSALVLVGGTTATITNSTFAGNSTPGAANGTVTVSGFSAATITNSTITGSDNFGLYADGGTASLSNTIIAGNGVNNCFVNASTFTSNGHNLASDSTCHLSQPTDLPGIDPQLLPLADNGGPTQTIALAAGSAAIDAGSCENDVDQRGYARPAGATCDIGAFEYGAAAPGPEPTSTTTFSGGGALSFEGLGLLIPLLLGLRRRSERATA